MYQIWSIQRSPSFIYTHTGWLMQILHPKLDKGLHDAWCSVEDVREHMASFSISCKDNFIKLNLNINNCFGYLKQHM